ncbi:MAG: LuxR family transcriptional regulator [Methylococcaceae bacterium]|nr:MAG: LuxR family transcriptional regulator [Methylococcaceae bacterium]
MTLDNRTEFIHGLWDELANFDAARSDEALLHLMGGLCTLTRAWAVTWVGAVRLEALLPGDAARGWRPRIIRHLHPSPPLSAATQEQADQLEQGEIDETTMRNLEGAGVFRANRLRDLVGPEWFESPYYRVYYQGLGHKDAVWVASPVNKDAESWLGMYRAHDQPFFSESERDELAYVLRGLKWFHRQLMLSQGLLVANSPLTPAERQVLRLLLTGLAEKAVAGELARSHHTVHECITSIYRKFGVNNRAALMALWLGQAA